MAYTQGELDALKSAYASGVTEMSYQGRTVKYRSLDEMSRIISAMDQELNGSTTKRTRRILLASRRGV